MSITPQYSTRELRMQLDERIERYKQMAVRRLAYVGELCVNRARSRGDYKDRTGNLRSSIGYAISVDGKIVTRSNARLVLNGQEGKETSMRYCERIALNIPNKIALILVAGMEYAEFVYDKGYDVLTTAELLANVELKKALNKLGI